MLRKESAPLSAAVNEYETRLKTTEEKVDMEEVSGMMLLREFKPSKQEVEQQESESKLLQQTTEEMLDSAVREAGPSPRYVKRLSERLEPQYADFLMSGTQRCDVWCVTEVSRLNHFTAENIPGHAVWCEEGSSRSSLQRERKVWVPIPSMLVAKKCKAVSSVVHYPRSCVGEDSGVGARGGELEFCDVRSVEKTGGSSQTVHS